MTVEIFSWPKCLKENVPDIVVDLAPAFFTQFDVIQVNLIITLSLGSMETDCVISELCYNEVIYNRHIAK